jgi:hypothetical protein
VVLMRERSAKQPMMPSPITWFTVPSKRCTASIIRSSTGSRILRASSGSRSASSSIEPLRSAKSTVTCLRSPSRTVLEVRIFSARCFGVYVSGDGDLTRRCARPEASATLAAELLSGRIASTTIPAQDCETGAAFAAEFHLDGVFVTALRTPHEPASAQLDS